MEGEEKNVGRNGYSAGVREFSEQKHVNSADYLEQQRRKEKFKSILIAILGSMALFFGLAFFVFNIKNPFLSLLAQAQKEQALAQKQQQLQLLALQAKDTDKDGLTDYDELNKYSTSPYLADSDSDGLTDKDEIFRGSDPNCAEGQNCFAAESGSSTTAYSAPSLNGSPSAQASPRITVEFIRQIMKNNGVDQTTLDSLTDQEILAEFTSYLNDNPDIAKQLAEAGYDFSDLSGLNAQVASSTLIGGGKTATSSKAAITDLKSLNVSTLSDLKKLSGSQIRQLMIDSGVSADLLSSVSDDQLKELFIKQIESKSNNN